MENSLIQEPSFSGFLETRDMEEEEEINDEPETELSMPLSEPEKLFVEAVRKLSRYEHSLETLVKRFDKHGNQTDNEIAERLRNSDVCADEATGRTDLCAGGNHSASRRQCQTSNFETAGRFRNSDAYAEEVPGRTDRSAVGNHAASRRQCQTSNSKTAERFRNSNIHAGEIRRRTHLLARGNLSVSRRQCQTSDDHQKYVKIQIPYSTAEILLRILDEDLDNNQRSYLKRAESLLSRARGNLVAVKSLLESHLENSGRFHDQILMEANEITNDMFTILNKLKEKLVECQVQNLSELLVKSMKDETKLSMLAKGPRTWDNEEGVYTKAMVSAGPSRSKAFYFIIFYFVAVYLIARLMMLYLERENAFIEKAYSSEWISNPFLDSNLI